MYFQDLFGGNPSTSIRLRNTCDWYRLISFARFELFVYPHNFGTSVHAIRYRVNIDATIYINGEVIFWHSLVKTL